MVVVWFAPRVGTVADATRPPLAGTGARATASRLRRRFQGVARCRRGGAYAIEFAGVASIIIVMFAAAAELTWQASVGAALDRGALNASRVGSLGRKNPDGTRAGPACNTAILRAAREGGGGRLNGDLRLTVTSYGSSRQAGLGQGGVNNAGLGGQMVSYSLQYHEPFIFVGRVFGLEKHVHTAVAMARNEPFPDGAPNAQSC
jgi:hypothetical protein